MSEWTVRQDVRQAIRTLRRQPGFSTAAIGMLALGFGATTAIFSVVKGALIDPLPSPPVGIDDRVSFPEPDRIPRS